MSVKAGELETPERGLRLQNRGSAVAAAAAESEPEPGAAAAELKDLRERIEAARKVSPKGRDLHCHDCFTRGRDAAIREILGEKG